MPGSRIELVSGRRMTSPPQLSRPAKSIKAPQPKPRGRLIELDILRGFLLVWMTLTHLPTKANLVSNQTFGFVSGAEGFIFLAGFMMGQLEHHIEQKRGQLATLRDIAKRTVRVYFYHCALLAIAFAVFAKIAVEHNRLALQNLLSFFLQSPKPAIVAAALLEYRPALLDILPMYVVFLALTPLARLIARRWTWDPVIYTSLLIWACAQFGLRGWMYRHVNLFGLSVPEPSTGAFDLYAWQLLWMAGLALGSINADRVAPPPEAPEDESELGITPWILRLSIAVALVSLVLRYLPTEHWFNPDIFGWLIDKWHLGPARVINFTALAIVLVRYGARIANLPPLRPLALLGQASLEVFSLQLLFCLAGDALSKEADPILSWWQQVLLLAVTMAGLFSIALASRWAKDKRKQQKTA
jgi:hypothetical protein